MMELANDVMLRKNDRRGVLSVGALKTMNSIEPEEKSITLVVPTFMYPNIVMT